MFYADSKINDMKKILVLFISCFFVASISSLQAQTYVGYTYSNLEGVSGAVFNPASIAGTMYQVDVNLFSGNVGIWNNAFTAKSSSLFKLKFSDWEEGNQYFKSTGNGPKNLFANIDVIGPSFMFSINSKHAVGFTSRFRFLANEENLSGDIFQYFGGNSGAPIYGRTFQQSDLRANIHAFADFGLTYGAVVFENYNHKIKAGLTAKWVFGLGAGSFTADNINVNLANSSTFGALNGSVSAAYSRGIDDLIGDNLNGDLFDYIGARGFGLDLGVAYEWTTNANRENISTSSWYKPTSYKLRAAVSVSDIGRLNYDVSPNSASYRLAVPAGTAVTDFDLNNQSLDQYLADLRTKGYLTSGTVNDLKVSLPTLLRANVDWQAWKGLYVNLDGAFNLLSKDAVGARYLSSVALTPRYESSWFSIYSPLSYGFRSFNGDYANENISWGFGFNVGIIYVGSSSVFSNLIRNEVRNADIHVGLHIPFFRSKASKAKPVEQPVYTPEPVQVIEPTPVEPRIDTVIKEVIVYVPQEVTVIEKVVEAPAEDPLANQINLLVQSVYFVTGSDWLLIESREPLNRVAALLKENKDVTITIGGHADSEGSDRSNQILSEQRAERVAEHLVGQGIDRSRITTVGYGASRPIAANVTNAGKAKNRRVEIKINRNE